MWHGSIMQGGSVVRDAEALHQCPITGRRAGAVPKRLQTKSYDAVLLSTGLRQHPPRMCSFDMLGHHSSRSLQRQPCIRRKAGQARSYSPCQLPPCQCP